MVVLVLTACAAPVRSEAPTLRPEARTSDQPILRLVTTTSTDDSGLLDFILPGFEQEFHATVDVIATGTGQALAIGRRGDADVLLVHDRPAEDRFVADGFARERFDVMYNDFIIVGPTEDPAKITGVALAKDAFKAIAEAEAPFVSRGDKSGTHSKELGIWASIPFTPTAATAWYHNIGQGMGDTLLFTNEAQGYTVADRGTYLALRDKLPGLTILVGGESLTENKDVALLNPYGALAVNPEKHPHVKYDLALKFVTWLLSAETQKAIGSYGVEKFGQPLFYPNAK